MIAVDVGRMYYTSKGEQRTNGGGMMLNKCNCVMLKNNQGSNLAFVDCQQVSFINLFLVSVFDSTRHYILKNASSTHISSTFLTFPNHQTLSSFKFMAPNLSCIFPKRSSWSLRQVGSTRHPASTLGMAATWS